MTSFFSSLLTNTTSRYTTLRRSLLSDENDGDTEDDSHISRVLRAYYVEKARPFPPWLPPDPKTPQVLVTPQYAHPLRPNAQIAQARRGSALSDLWDTPKQPQAGAPPSLRRSEGSSFRNTPAPQRDREALTTLKVPSLQHLQPQGSRPLPSQREGSYQNQVSQQSARPERPPLQPSQSSSAQDRLKAKLWGGGRPGGPIPAVGTNPSQSAARLAFERAGNHTSSY